MRAAARSLLIAASWYAAIAFAAPESGEYVWRLPPGFPAPIVPAGNPMSEAKVALGCKLFSETQLSITRQYSCASCHRAELAFTDGRARAIGAKGDSMQRGAMSLANVAYNMAFTWANDRVVTLEEQMDQPLFNTHPIEMGLRREDPAALAPLTQSQEYSAAFGNAFPGEPEPITMTNAIKAIAAYERTLISGRSAFDRYVFDDDRGALSPQAKLGMKLFFSDQTGCAGCHFGLNFSGPVVHIGKKDQAALFANNGAAWAGSGDDGLMAVTKREQDRGRFRVPTLRNIALTAPYMHDGRFATLEAVVDHYSHGGRTASSIGAIDPLMRVIDLSVDEKEALIEFLRSLTDEGFVKGGCPLPNPPPPSGGGN